jgi:hypothetical protein
MEQYHFMLEKSRQLTDEMDRIADEMRLLMNVEIKPLKIGF